MNDESRVFSAGLSLSDQGFLALEELVFRKVDKEEHGLMRRVFRLRFDVYSQKKFIEQDDYADKCEIDEYDTHAQHFVCLDSQGTLLGSTRILFPEHGQTPFEKHCRGRFHDNFQLSDYQRYAEISRFIILKELTGRRNRMPSEIMNSNRGCLNSFDSFIQSKAIVRGLCQKMLQELSQTNVHYVFALMERSLRLLLCLYGIRFSCVGEEINFWGPVRPYLLHVKDTAKIFPNLSAGEAGAAGIPQPQLHLQSGLSLSPAMSSS